MPELELTGDHNIDYGYLRGLMLYPADEQERNRYYGFYRLKGAVTRAYVEKTTQEPAFTALDMEMALSVPPGMEIVERANSLTRRYGEAGMVLCFLASLHLAGIEAPSQKKALHVLGRYLQHLEGFQRRSDESTFRAFIKEAAPALHLWAAYGDIENERQSRNALDTVQPEDIPALLAISEKYRRFGEQYVPVRAKVPLLQTEETWKVPINHSLPPISESRSLSLPAWIETAIKEYRHGHLSPKGDRR